MADDLFAKFQDGHSFAAPAETHDFNGLLFDMDGTIIESTPAVIKHWHDIGAELGVDPNVILQTSHGRRSIDVLKLYDPSRANWEYVTKVESRIPIQYGYDAIEIPGSRALLTQLEDSHVPWGIVTSGSLPLVTGWLKVMSLLRPSTIVTAEDVQNGKPDPACYLLGRERLGLSASARRILVLEDAPAGVRAGKAAGFEVVALATTHHVEQLKEAGADWIVRDLRSVKLKGWDAQKGMASVEIANALVE